MKTETEAQQSAGVKPTGGPASTEPQSGAVSKEQAYVCASGAVCRYREAASRSVQVGPFSFDVQRREFFSLVGPHGCGKSTLLRMVAGLLVADAGKVEVSGNPVRSVLTDIGFLSPASIMLGWRSVLRNVTLQAELRGLDRRRSIERARLLLASMGLSELEGQRSHRLPREMAPRVAVCRALVHSPGLLLADDPFQSLDSLTRENASMDLQRLWLREPVTVLYATSQIEEAVQLSNRVAVMCPDGSGIAETVCVELPHPRRMDRATTPQIVEYSNRIRTIFHGLGVF